MGQGPASDWSFKSLTLARWNNHASDHWITTGNVTSDYYLEGSLGALVGNGTRNSRALYGCLYQGRNHFLSLDPKCEGYQVLGQEQNVLTVNGPNELPLFRCQTHTGSHFASNDPKCEGNLIGGQLGYTITAAPLNRYRNSQDHWLTTGSVTAGYSLEGSLNLMMAVGAGGTHPIYGCLARGWDHFLSGRSDCEGNGQFMYIEGWLYDRPTSGRVPVYRCRVGLDHFASSRPDCEGQAIDGSMGWAWTRVA